MGLTSIERRTMAQNGRQATVNLMVNSGAGHSLLPHPFWRSQGLQPTRMEKFLLADGNVVTRNMFRCYSVLPQGEEYSPVAPGDEGGGKALPGPVTLENLGLMSNSFSRTLHPMRLLWQD